MGLCLIEGVSLTPLKQIHHPLGDVYHGLKSSEQTFERFGEAYFSFVDTGAIKGWKLHKKMQLNLLVPIGKVKFVIFDQTTNRSTEVMLSAEENYQRLTIEPGLWVAFQGKNPGKNLILNVASLEHDPEESLMKSLKEIPYEWT